MPVQWRSIMPRTAAATAIASTTFSPAAVALAASAIRLSVRRRAAHYVVYFLGSRWVLRAVFDKLRVHVSILSGYLWAQLCATLAPAALALTATALTATALSLAPAAVAVAAAALAAATFVRRRRRVHLHWGGDLLLDGHVAHRARGRGAWLHALRVGLPHADRLWRGSRHRFRQR